MGRRSCGESGRVSKFSGLVPSNQMDVINLSPGERGGSSGGRPEAPLRAPLTGCSWRRDTDKRLCSHTATPGSRSIHRPQRLFVPDRPVPGPHPPKKQTEQLWFRISHTPTTPGKHAAQRLLVSQFGTLCAERWPVNGGAAPA